MDEQGGEYRWWRRGKWEGYRHGARNRRYFEEVEADNAEAHSSSKYSSILMTVMLAVDTCVLCEYFVLC